MHRGSRPRGFLILHSRGASADGVGPKLEPLADTTQFAGIFGICTYCSSGRGLRRDTRGYYQGVGTPRGLAGLVLPLSKYLVHRDSEFDRVVPKIRGFTSADRESL